MTITPELREIYASGDNANTYLETLEFSHPRFSKPFYLVNDHEAWNFDLGNGTVVQFDSFPFAVTLPESTTEGRQDLQFVLGNVGRVLIDELELAIQEPMQPILVKYRVYLNVQNSLPQNDPILELNVTDVSATAETISATSQRYDIINQVFPSRLYTIKEFPGLLR